jgi:CBS-domain-containing membrane protein
VNGAPLRPIDHLVPALASAGALAVIGLSAWDLGVPWLFPSLGPTLAIQSELPDSEDAQPWNVVMGHAIGAAVGIASVWLTGAVHDTPVNLAHALSGARLASAVVALGTSMALQSFARAEHPPAQATTLLIAVGALGADLHGAMVLTVGVLQVAVLGEAVRRLRLRMKPGTQSEFDK